MSAALLDTIKSEGQIKSDLRLAKLLQMQPSCISKIRSGAKPVTGDVMLKIYDEVGMSIERIRALAAA